MARAKTSPNGKTKRPPKAKQGHLPDMEPPKVDEIEQAADAYRELRDHRMQLGKDEADARKVLMAAMLKHKIKTYTYDDYEVFIEQGAEKVRVKSLKIATDEEDEDGDED